MSVRESTSWQDRLRRERARAFVGREAELDLFRSALDADPPFAVLWIVGPGGIGKSTLLHRMADLAQERGVTPVRVDARALLGSSLSFLDHLAGALEVAPSDAVETLRDTRRCALLIDTAEDLGDEETWLRESLLPSLPVGHLVIVAGRRPPSAQWRTDAAWTDLLRVVSLRNLSPADATRLLHARKVDASQHASLVFATHGHPLSLALAADVIAQAPGTASADVLGHPDLVAALLSRFKHDAPDDTHRKALAIAAHVRLTNEPTLRHGLELDDARKYFDWLASLSFAVAAPDGLYLHDLAAQALDADDRRRDPQAYASLHARLRGPIIAELATSTGAPQYRAAMDLSFMHRFSAVMGAVVDWEGSRALRPAPLRDADVPVLVEATRRHEGDRAAERIAAIAAVQPEAFTMVRASDQQTSGYICSLMLRGDAIEQPGIADLIRDDPRVAFVLRAIESRRPVMAEDRIELCVWMGYATHVDPCALVSQLSIANIRSWFGGPGLTWGAFAVPARLDTWGPMMAYLDHQPIGDVELGEATYAMFLHDWRSVPATAYLDMMSAREIMNSAENGSLAPPREVLALSHPDFAAATKQALRDYCEDDRLAQSPLSQCRLARDLADAEPSPLRTALDRAAETLSRSGRDESLHAALKLTYLDPARTQEEAAELLGVPFSTYRRHLGAAIDRVVAYLWERDLTGW